ncbi:hypothetical protein [Halorarius halobius]|uniref:hypothetical protein n=1 Tax=Halorarius halobius TaxID=2962671 RepID=UPI0020CD9A23|nr:hypothetical protein [Halorarius halobius]
MTENSPAAMMDSLTDPEPLADRDDVDYRERTHHVDADEFPAVRDDLGDTAGWAVVGVVNGAGRILLMDDGSHGWTLPAVPVASGGDWVAAAEGVVESLTGATPGIGRPERVRRVDYRENGGGGHVIVHHVVLPAAPVAGDPVADDPTVGCDTAVAVDWVDALPDELEGAVAEDARLFL